MAQQADKKEISNKILFRSNLEYAEEKKSIEIEKEKIREWVKNNLPPTSIKI
jgi:hypothetical protein